MKGITDENYKKKYNEWKENYIEYLKDHINKRNECPYIDPDGTHNLYDSYFYAGLVAFLNARENVFFENNPTKWIYEQHTYLSKDGTPSCILVKNSEKDVILYLRSDLFGFSAPSHYNNSASWHSNKYPYAKYLNFSMNENKKENVANWVWNTRTIGGGFLWPILVAGWTKRNKLIAQWENPYNAQRGVCSFIEDRIDLTLWEIRNYYIWRTKDSNRSKRADEYSRENTSDRLRPMMEYAKFGIWLDHFQTFENYVDFFKLNDFVKASDGQYVPINITTGKALETKDIPEKKHYLINNLDVNKPIGEIKSLEEVLEWLSQTILKRSETMRRIINGEDNNQSEQNN